MKGYKLIIYSGITNNMARRQKEHAEGKCRTTNRYNKSYKLIGIKFMAYYENPRHNIEDLEKKFKKMSIANKLKESISWERWRGD